MSPVEGEEILEEASRNEAAAFVDISTDDEEDDDVDAEETGPPTETERVLAGRGR